MTLVLWMLAVLLIGASFLALAVPNLPGPPMLLGGMLLAAWAEDFQYVGFKTLLLLGILSILAVMADALAGAWSTNRFGGSGYAVTGAALGALAGLFWGLPGVVLGPFVGAIVGELIVGRGLRSAGRAGLGAWVGIVVGTGVKAALMFGMLGVFILARLL